MEIIFAVDIVHICAWVRSAAWRGLEVVSSGTTNGTKKNLDDWLLVLSRRFVYTETLILQCCKRRVYTTRVRDDLCVREGAGR